MPKSMPLQLNDILSPELYARLQTEAERQNADLIKVAREAIEAYLENIEDPEDTPDEDIEAGFLQGGMRP